MKYGMRKPNLKKSIKARTTGKVKRSVKRAVNPYYGKKGMGWVNDPKKAAYNKVYNKTSFSVNPLSDTGKKSSSAFAIINVCSLLIIIFVLLVFLLVYFL